MGMLLRLWRHLTASTLRTRSLFSAAVLSRIERAVTEAERQHSGEIRFAVETALPLPLIWRGLTPRARALQVFGQLRVWDTDANNGVLIYVLRADRAVEVIADRGIGSRVKDLEWEALCHEVENYYRARRYSDGSAAAVAGVARLIGQHFPAGGSGTNELPNQPVLL